MKRLLLVEENEDTAGAVKIILNNAGYEVDIVEHGYECGEMMKATDYDLILLDLLPPEMYGYDIYETLSRKCKTKYAFHSTITLSPGIVRLFRKVGINDHIEKPYSKVDLLNRIQGILR